MLKGLETLPVRIAQQSASAARIADHLTTLGCVSRVVYPFRPDHPQAALARRQMRNGGTLVTFEIDGGNNSSCALDPVQAERLLREVVLQAIRGRHLNAQSLE